MLNWAVTEGAIRAAAWEPQGLVQSGFMVHGFMVHGRLLCGWEVSGYFSLLCYKRYVKW